jgi:hypothetical protein
MPFLLPYAHIELLIRNDADGDVAPEAWPVVKHEFAKALKLRSHIARGNVPDREPLPIPRHRHSAIPDRSAISSSAARPFHSPGQPGRRKQKPPAPVERIGPEAADLLVITVTSCLSGARAFLPSGEGCDQNTAKSSFSGAWYGNCHRLERHRDDASKRRRRWRPIHITGKAGEKGAAGRRV